MLDFGFYNMDCMDGLREFPDKYFDLAISDPPYGINCSTYGCGSRKKKYDRSKEHKWDDHIPDENYFQQLFRVSKNQIIFGMNYYNLPTTREFVVWDKKQPDSVTFAQAELIWTSFSGTSKIVSLSSRGQEQRIHQAQKPVELYDWILSKYAKPGDKILDTHVGSASSLIACHKNGFDYVGFELDPYYFKLAGKRLNEYKAQITLFDCGMERR